MELEGKLSNPIERFVNQNQEDEFSDIPQGKFYLLAHGVDNYEHHRDLECAVSDTDKICELLERKYGFIVEKIPPGADNDEIFDYVRSYKEISKITDQDFLVIWLAGHGALDDSSLQYSYFLPQNANPAPKHGNWVNMETLIGYFNDISAHQILLIMDCCFSGGIFSTRELPIDPTDPEFAHELEYLRWKGRQGLTSGRKIDPVLDKKIDGRSPFAAALLNTLKAFSGPMLTAADLDRHLNLWAKSNFKIKQKHRLGHLDNTGVSDQGGFVFFNHLFRPNHVDDEQPEIEASEVEEASQSELSRNWDILMENPTITKLEAFLRQFPGSEFEPEVFFQKGLLKCAAGQYFSGISAFEEAAKRNHSDAAYHLGLLYEEGVGLEADEKHCRYWLEIAASLGHGEAKDKIRQSIGSEVSKSSQHKNGSKEHIEFNPPQVLEPDKTIELGIQKQPPDTKVSIGKKVMYGLAVATVMAIFSTPIIREVIYQNKSEAAKEHAITTNTIEGFNELAELYSEHSELATSEILRLETEKRDLLDEGAYNSALSKNSIEAFEAYLTSFPEGNFVSEAKDKIQSLKEKATEQDRLAQIAKDDAAWDEAKAGNRSSDFQKYITNFPSGEHIVEAKSEKEIRVEEELFKSVSTQGSTWSKKSRIEQYLTQYPSGRFLDKIDELAWNLASREDNYWDYEWYLEKFESGKKKILAKDRFDKGKEKSEFEKAKRAIGSNNYLGKENHPIANYISAYPNGIYYNELYQSSKKNVLDLKGRVYSSQLKYAIEHAKLFGDEQIFDQWVVNYLIGQESLTQYVVGNYENEVKGKPLSELKREATLGNINAQINYASETMFNGNSESIRILEKLASEGNKYAINNLALYHFRGSGNSPQNIEKSIDLISNSSDASFFVDRLLFLKIVKYGALHAEHIQGLDFSNSSIIGALYFDGRYIERDLEKAISYLSSQLQKSPTYKKFETNNNIRRYLLCKAYNEKGDEFMAKHWCSQISSEDENEKAITDELIRNRPVFLNNAQVDPIQPKTVQSNVGFTVSADGSVIDSKGVVIGRVDAGGNIINPSGQIIGRVQKSSSVMNGIQGDKPTTVPMKILYKAQPKYPERAKQQDKETFIELEYSVSRYGYPMYIRVVDYGNHKSPFDEAAIKALKKFRFSPKTVDGEKVRSSGHKQRFTFKIED